MYLFIVQNWNPWSRTVFVSHDPQETSQATLLHPYHLISQHSVCKLVLLGQYNACDNSFDFRKVNTKLFVKPFHLTWYCMYTYVGYVIIRIFYSKWHQKCHITHWLCTNTIVFSPTQSKRRLIWQEKILYFRYVLQNERFSTCQYFFWIRRQLFWYNSLLLIWGVSCWGSHCLLCNGWVVGCFQHHLH